MDEQERKVLGEGNSRSRIVLEVPPDTDTASLLRMLLELRSGTTIEYISTVMVGDVPLTIRTRMNKHTVARVISHFLPKKLQW